MIDDENQGISMMIIATKLEAAKAGIAAINHHDLAELRSALWGLDQRDAALAVDGARNHIALALHDLQRAVILHQEANSADRG